MMYYDRTVKVLVTCAPARAGMYPGKAGARARAPAGWRSAISSPCDPVAHDTHADVLLYIVIVVDIAMQF